ncbi:sensor histidine kinase [Sporomusa sp.]|uniref:sensor histidine kinase n=1 Tax=Sporomusa sp. TaxID=2078658 RepID=UPI002C28E291|nr:histidine kinase dimerization/phospho-acceptor domain-containing protein [Sporomusa sp.]HWR44993.1 histidine kinase dimerization/phospho-acceptor domain-containing protein [Sporomusa sp.]
MTLSIRTKLFIILSGLILFFVLISLGLIRLGLEKYYVWQKKDILIANSNLVDDLYRGRPEEITLELERIASTLGAGVIIFTQEGYIKYSSFSRIINQKLHDTPLAPALPPPYDKVSKDNPFHVPPAPPYALISKEAVDSRTIIEMQHDQNLRIEFMALERHLRNNDILIIRQPLAPVSESAVVAAQFMAFTGILVLLLGCTWAFLFAKKFTLPIVELNRIAQSMARLDFSLKCTVNRSDELGELGKSINHLSEQLDSAIIELSKKNQQLMADMEKERALDAMRKNFVSSVSHELKTPLSLILGYAEGLKENVAHDEESKNYYCSIIIDEAEKMDKLVKDLLNLSQIESGLFQLNRTDFDLLTLLNDIIKKYQTILEEKAINLEIDGTSSHYVNGDILRIEQVLLNIFTNAMYHSDFAKIIKIGVKDTGNKIKVSIFNSGRPIPGESLEKLWTSFYKVDKARTREHGRYGLGLSIVRAIQEQHGNSYGVDNLQDGVIFWFELDKAGKI